MASLLEARAEFIMHVQWASASRSDVLEERTIYADDPILQSSAGPYVQVYFGVSIASAV